MNNRDMLIAVLVAFAWGSNFTAVRLAIIEIPGLLALAIRFAITALILLPFIKFPKVSFKLLLRSSIVFGVLYLGTLYYGMHLGLNTSLSIILMQLNVPISIIIARVVLDEHFTRKALLGICIAFMGMMVVAGTPDITGNLYAVIIVLIAAFFCALFNIQNKQLKAVTPLSLLFFNSLISAPFLFIISYFTEGNPIELIQGTSYIMWLAILYSALISGILGIGLWIYLLQKYPVYKVSPFNLLVPFFGVASTLFIEDMPSWHIFVGGAITLLGIAVTQIRRL